MTNEKQEVEALRDMSVEELQGAVAEARKQLFQLKVGQAVEGNQLGMSARVLRRQIARLLTLIAEKEAEVTA